LRLFSRVRSYSSATSGVRALPKSADRWQALADDGALHAGSGFYTFNDFHAVMAFVSAPRAAL